MSYGTNSLDVGKVTVLLSCIFNVFMTYLIATDPAGVIASPYGRGWWDPLQTIESEKTHIYPRIWATNLILQLVVRLNWVFTNEVTPSLYRCVLVSYVLPFFQYVLETVYFESMPPMQYTEVAFMMIPWAVIIVSYPKYTQEKTPTTSSKKQM